ncbi:tyrosine-type recombinase/integrase, partial [Mesorhizobium captivum]|uniref:tyrosine-type recombinase/integrase n=1 Tax=Mesorhizobium captivum TaxID=3072319 RepID=UPI002A24EA55
MSVDSSAELIRAFLIDIEVTLRCSMATRNQRLAAIRAFAGFLGEHSPSTSNGWAKSVLSRSRRPIRRLFLTSKRREIDALLAAPDRRTEQGRRDYALLPFLYNTGARASEAAGIKVADLDLNAPSVKILGKAVSSDTAHYGPPPSSSYGHSS